MGQRTGYFGTRRLNWRPLILFAVGLAALVALTLYAGAADVLRVLESLSWFGLVTIAFIHLPVVIAMGVAWWRLGIGIVPAAAGKFILARFVRDAAAEVLPFSQIGGFVLGTRALSLHGIGALAGALSMSVDLVIELWAKLPYFLAGLLVAFTYAPHSRLIGTLVTALLLTAALVALPVLFRARVVNWVKTQASALIRRWPRLGTDEDVHRYLTRLMAEPRHLIFAFAVHLLCWFFGAAETWAALMLMHRPVTALQALAIDSLVSGLRSFGFLVPAAAGVQEASYVVICALFAVSPATAVALSLARRARDLLIGAPVLALWQYHEAHGFRLRKSY